MAKLIVIIGITGNQGGSVAKVFLDDPLWRVRGLTRNMDSPASQTLIAQGVEMITADLHDPPSLNGVFTGANLVFSVTDFWMPYLNPANHACAAKLGRHIGRYAYEQEYEQGKNIVDAVSRVVDGLDDINLIASTLSNARICSGGKYEELWHFDSKADVFPGYLEKAHPALAKKTSYIHTGYFMTSWRILPKQWFGKLPDGTIQMRFPTRPDTKVPHIDPRKDTGRFVRALLSLPQGTTVMAAGEWCTWPEWIETFSQVTGVKSSYQQCTVDDFDKWLPGGIGKEIGEMYEYSNEPGYDGGDPKVLRLRDLKELGIHVPVTTLREYIEEEDWVSAGILDA